MGVTLTGVKTSVRSIERIRRLDVPLGKTRSYDTTVQKRPEDLGDCFRPDERCGAGEYHDSPECG